MHFLKLTLQTFIDGSKTYRYSLPLSELQLFFPHYLNAFSTSALEYVVADSGNLGIIYESSFLLPNFATGGKSCWFCLQNLVLICPHPSITHAGTWSNFHHLFLGLLDTSRLFPLFSSFPTVSPFSHGEVRVVVVKFKADQVSFALRVTGKFLLTWSSMSLPRLVSSLILDCFSPAGSLHCSHP